MVKFLSDRLSCTPFVEFSDCEVPLITEDFPVVTVGDVVCEKYSVWCPDVLVSVTVVMSVLSVVRLVKDTTAVVESEVGMWLDEAVSDALVVEVLLSSAALVKVAPVIRDVIVKCSEEFSKGACVVLNTMSWPVSADVFRKFISPFCVTGSVKASDTQVSIKNTLSMASTTLKS